MMHSKNIPDQQWSQVKGEIQKTWNRLDADELEQTHGDVQAISKLVQKRYSMSQDQTDEKLDDVIERCGTSAGPASYNNKQSFSEDEASSSVSANSSTASFKAAKSAKSAGPADLGANVDPSSLSASINQTSSPKSSPRDANAFGGPEFTEQDEDVHASSFDAPEEGLDSAQALNGADADMDIPQRDSRAPEDFNTNEPKRFGSERQSSEGQVNESRSQTRQTGDSSRSRANEGSTGDSRRPDETFEKSARNAQGARFSQAEARDSESNSARNTRSSEDSSQGE